ncbi:hypothetical protein SAMN05216386_2578 [Nitrosospira briensis]|uniref:Uncharacterized protein n=1 Tax=Nitrosospira briensis TaxID=35799 RepID=A0A1I5EB31_9PROT|nr:hypothetical protein [Nitrosospira briensis]SFO08533.1 hypothetical protein SAMN05216386_2578 [Nitrosospira briensis]
MDYDIKKLYTDKLDAYLSFSSFFRYPKGSKPSSNPSSASGRVFAYSIPAAEPASPVLRLKALQHRGLHFQAFQAFDLTPAMLASFSCLPGQAEYCQCAIAGSQRA